MYIYHRKKKGEQTQCNRRKKNVSLVVLEEETGPSVSISDENRLYVPGWPSFTDSEVNRKDSDIVQQKRFYRSRGNV